MTTKEAFEVYAAKGPVNYPGTQWNAHRAYKYFKRMLTEEERTALSIAQSHALGDEGRAEFDAVCQKIRDRLFKPL